MKLTLLAIAGAASFFPTTIIVQRAVEQRKLGDAPIAPMSEKLAARMTSILNAELLAFLSIPLAATLMSRGVGYAEWLPWQAQCIGKQTSWTCMYRGRRSILGKQTPWTCMYRGRRSILGMHIVTHASWTCTWLPWQVGAAPVVLVLGGLGFKYVKEALDWAEDPVEAAVDGA